MATFTPHYRMRLYAPRSVDSAETSLLVPRAGAAHADAFRVATVRGLAGYQPYLGLPRGLTRRLDPITRKIETAELTIPVLDARLLTNDQAVRWVSQFLGNALGQPQLLGCRLELDELTDPTLDPTLEASWANTRYFTGRVEQSPLAKLLWYELAARDGAEELNTDLFVGRAQQTTSYVSSPSLYPVGLTQAYGPFPTLAPAIAGTLVTFSAPAGTPETARTARFDIGGSGLGGLVQFAQHWSNIPWAFITKTLRDRLRFHDVRITWGDDDDDNDLTWVDPGLSIVLKEAPIRLRATRADTGASGEYEVLHLTSEKPNRVWHVRKLFLKALPATDPAYLPLPSGDATTVLTNCALVAADYRPTAATPWLISDVHVVQLIADILDGKLSQRDPATGAVVPIAARAKTADWVSGDPWSTLIADPSWGTVRMTITEGAKAREFVEAHLLRPYGLGWRLNARNEVELVDFRTPTAAQLAGVPTIGADDVTVGGIGQGWSNTRAGAIGYVETAYTLEGQWPAKVMDSNDDEYPDVPPGRLVAQAQRVNPSDVLGVGDAIGGRVLDLRAGAHQLDALGYRASATDQAAQRETAARLARVGDQMQAPFLAGPMTQPVQGRRGATSVKGCLPGDLRIVDLPAAPNPAANSRGGPRLARCIGWEPTGPSLKLTFLDLGASSVSVVPSLAAPAQDALAPRSRVTAAVTLNAGGESAVLEYAITETSVSTRPGATSAAWLPARRLTASGTVTIDRLPAGKRVWVRARSEVASQAAIAGGAAKLASAWAFPGTGTGYVDTAALPAPSAAAAPSPGGTTARITWTNGDDHLETEILLATGSAPSSWVTATHRVASLPARATSYRLVKLAVSTGYTVGVRHRDQLGGVSAVATVSFTTGATPATAPRVAGAVVIPALTSIRGSGSQTPKAPSAGDRADEADTGVALGVYPSDATYDVKLERAPNSAGAPDTGAIVTAAVVSAAQLAAAVGVLVDPRPADGATWWYRVRHAADGENDSPATPWMSAVAGFLPDPLVRPAPMEPVEREKPSASTTIGTLLLEIDDPQLRVTDVAFATASGNTDLGAYASDTELPYGGDVALSRGAPSRVAWRYTFYDAHGVLRERSNVVPFPALSGTATLSVTQTVAASDAITDTVALGTATAWVDIWTREYTTDPGTVGSVEFVGTREDAPLRRGDGRSSISFPIAGSAHYLVRTYVAYDAQGNRGQILTLKTQGAAPAQPLAPTAVAAGSAGTNWIEQSVTMPADVTTGPFDRIAVYVNGVRWGDVARLAGASAAQTVRVGSGGVGAALGPGTSYAIKYKGMVSGGVESAAFSPERTDSTAGVTLDAPTGLAASRIAAPVILVEWSAGANNPSGTVFEIQQAPDNDGDGTENGAYADPGDGATESTQYLYDTDLRSPARDYFRVRATKPGYTSSGWAGPVYA